VPVRRQLVVLPLLPGLGLGSSACRQDPGSGGPTEASAPSTDAVTAAAALAFRSVSPGMMAHTCGVTTGDQAYCWGNNGFGQGYGPLGNGTDITLRLRPVAVVGGLKFRQVSAGSGHRPATAQAVTGSIPVRSTLHLPREALGHPFARTGIGASAAGADQPARSCRRPSISMVSVQQRPT
jgi:hypothetical protein